MQICVVSPVIYHFVKTMHVILFCCIGQQDIQRAFKFAAFSILCGLLKAPANDVVHFSVCLKR